MSRILEPTHYREKSRTVGRKNSVGALVSPIMRCYTPYGQSIRREGTDSSVSSDQQNFAQLASGSIPNTTRSCVVFHHLIYDLVAKLPVRLQLDFVEKLVGS